MVTLLSGLPDEDDDGKGNQIGNCVEINRGKVTMKSMSMRCREKRRLGERRVII